MKKIIAWVSGPLIVAVPAALTVGLLSYGASRTAQTQFINYVDYISDAARARLRQTYGYREFADLPELRSAIENQQIPAGVGSDYYNVQLANAGLIQKLDFNAILDGTVVGGRTFSVKTPLSRAEIKTALQGLYTKSTWDLLTAFNSELNNSAEGSELWEYMVPYFIQQKEIIYNPYKVTARPGHEAALAALKSFDQTEINAVFNNDLTYQNIFRTLSRIGFSNLAVNNYMRDNLAIASEALYGKDAFSTTVTSENFQSLVDAFGDVINSFSGNKRIIDSGYETLSAVHSAGNSELYQADVGLLYNGDALDAFNGFDQVEGETHPEFSAQVRVVTPQNSTFLLDGVVVPTYVKGANLTQVNQVLKFALYDNVNNVNQAWDYDENDATTRLSINEFNMAYANFDFVNYTTPFQAIFDDASANYFSDLNSAELDADGTTPLTIVGSGDYAKRIFGLNGSPDLNHLTKPIAPNLETRVQSAYQAKIRALF